MQYLKLEKWVGGVVFKDVFMSPELDCEILDSNCRKTELALLYYP